jgi:prepilin-type N-terminal cleavage/methylation domain-containing protein
MKYKPDQLNSRGFTLVELLITVGLFTIILAIAIGGFINAINTQRQISSLISAQSNVSLALEQVTREIRTGYLFCNAPGNTNPGVITPNADPDCDCVLATSILPTAPDGSWVCKALDFYDAEGAHVEYALPTTGSASGTLSESTDGGATFQSITGNDVSLKYLEFWLFGQVEGDHWTPRITITMGIAPSSTDPGVEGDVFNLETTVSARTIDCVPNADPAQC